MLDNWTTKRKSHRHLSMLGLLLAFLWKLVSLAHRYPFPVSVPPLPLRECLWTWLLVRSRTQVHSKGGTSWTGRTPKAWGATLLWEGDYLECTLSQRHLRPHKSLCVGGATWSDHSHWRSRGREKWERQRAASSLSNCTQGSRETATDPFPFRFERACAAAGPGNHFDWMDICYLRYLRNLRATTSWSFVKII